MTVQSRFGGQEFIPASASKSSRGGVANEKGFPIAIVWMAHPQTKPVPVWRVRRRHDLRWHEFFGTPQSENLAVTQLRQSVSEASRADELEPHWGVHPIQFSAFEGL